MWEQVEEMIPHVIPSEASFLWLFVFLVQYLHQVFGHVVGFFSAAIIPLQILH